MSILKDRSQLNVVVIGAGGAIGSAMIESILKRDPHATINALSHRSPGPEHSQVIPYKVDLTSSGALEGAFEMIAESGGVDLLIYAAGLLHKDPDIAPEKALSHLEKQALEQVFQINTVTPMLVMKEAVKLLKRKEGSVWGFLSARVGSISDNHLGGWYSYRASKAALNMAIRTASIELKRLSAKSCVIGLHPGTVDSQLSRPFQGRVPDGKLFTASYSASCLNEILFNASPEMSGRLWAYDGCEIAP